MAGRSMVTVEAGRVATRRAGPSPALRKAEGEVGRLKSRLARIREVGEEQAEELQSLAIEGGAAFAFGSYERQEALANRTVPTIAGLPPRMAWGGALYIAGKLVGGRMGEVVTSAGRGLLIVEAYEKGKAGT